MVHNFKNPTMPTSNSRLQNQLPHIHELDLGPTFNLEFDNRHISSQTPLSSSSAGIHNTLLTLACQPTPSVNNSGPSIASPSLHHTLNGFHLHLPYAYASPPASHCGSVSDESSTIPTPSSTTASPRLEHSQSNLDSLPSDELISRSSVRIANSDRPNTSTLQKTRRDRVAKASTKGKTVASRAKNSNTSFKEKDEQKRRCNESEKLKTMELALIRSGYRHTQGLSTQNKKVSGLEYNKCETSEEAILDRDELEDPARADLHHVARLGKLMYRMKETPKLLRTVEKLPTLSLSPSQLEELARNIQKMLPDRYLHVAGIKSSDIQYEEATVHTRDLQTDQLSSHVIRFKPTIEELLRKSFHKLLRQLSRDELLNLVYRLAELLKEETKTWQRQKASLRLRIIRLKLELLFIDRGYHIVPRSWLQQKFNPLFSKQISRPQLWKLARCALRRMKGSPAVLQPTSLSSLKLSRL